MTISMAVDADEIGGSIRVTQEIDGTLLFETECGIREIIQVHDAAYLCPEDALICDYYIHDRPDTIPGLRGLMSFTADLDDVMINHFAAEGYGIIEIGDYTLFYKMTDDYGPVKGNAVIEADGSVYFVGVCGMRERIIPGDDLP